MRKCPDCGAEQIREATNREADWSEWACGRMMTNEGHGSRACPSRIVEQMPELNPPAAPAAKSPTAESKPLPIEQQLAKWSATDAEILAAVESTKGLTVAGFIDGPTGKPNPKKGRDVVHDAYMGLMRIRTGIEARRVELKAPVNEIAKRIDSEAKRLTALVVAREAELKADRDAYDAEEQRIKDAAAAEKKRKEDAEREEKRKALQLRVDQVNALGGPVDLAGLAVMTDDEFAALVARLESEKAARDAAAAKEKAERERQEAEQRERHARADGRSRELYALGAYRPLDELADMDQQTFDQILGEARTAKEKKDADAAAERKRLDDERKRLDDERAELDRKAEEQRKERERIDAEKKADQERQEAADRAARLERERPEREQVIKWCDDVEHKIAFESPVVKEQGVFRVMAQGQKKICDAILEMRFALQEPAA